MLMLGWDTVLTPGKDTLYSVQFVLYVPSRRHPPKFQTYQVPVYLGIYICGFPESVRTSPSLSPDKCQWLDGTHLILNHINPCLSRYLCLWFPESVRTSPSLLSWQVSVTGAHTLIYSTLLTFWHIFYTISTVWMYMCGISGESQLRFVKGTVAWDGIILYRCLEITATFYYVLIWLR